VVRGERFNGLSHLAGAEWAATNRVHVLTNGPSDISATLFDRYREVWERKQGGAAMPKLGVSRRTDVADAASNLGIEVQSG